MHAYLKKKSRIVLVQLDEGEQEQGAETAEQGTTRVPVPNSGTKVKHAKMKIAQTAITSFIVSGPVKPTNTEVLQVSKFHALSSTRSSSSK